jgi:hypothetical protein
MNWTSAKVNSWQSDCDAYRKLNKPFQLRDVQGRTQEAFALIYALQFGINYNRDGSTVTFSPK